MAASSETAAALHDKGFTILHYGGGDAVRYRCEHLGEQLRLLGLPVTVQEFVRGVGAAIAPCAAVVLHRVPLDGFLRRQLATIRRRRTVVLVDADDLVFDMNEAIAFARSIGESWVRRAMFREDVRNFRRTLTFAEGALVSTAFLAEQVRVKGQCAWIHRNAASAEMLASAEQARRGCCPRGGRISLVYASGTSTHERDFRLIAPILRDLLVRHANAELRLVGHIAPDIDWGSVASRVVTLPFVPWRQLPGVLAEGDINLAPLEVGRPFCEAKSEIKYVEAALVGMPTVASSTGAFRDAIRSGDNGFLAESASEWQQHLELLTVDGRLRAEIGARALADVLARYHPQTRAEELRRTLDGVFTVLRGRPLFLDETPAMKRPSQEVGMVGEAPSPRRSHLRQAWYSLRYDSPRSFLLRMMVFAAVRFARPAGPTDERRVEGVN